MSSVSNKIANKRLNQFSIFRELYFGSPLTKKELSENTNLSTPTVSKALSGLSARNLISEKGRKDIPTGRKPKTYGLNNSSVYGLGVDLEIPDVRVAIYDLSRRMIASKGTYLDIEKLRESPTNLLTEKLNELLSDLLEHEGLAKKSILGAGIAASGVVKDGSFRPFSRFESSTDIKLKRPLEDKLGVRTSLGNDLDLQLLSQLDRLGPIENTNHVAIYFGARLSGKRQPVIRIGGSIAIGGKIFRGSGGSTGEFGHMSVASVDISGLPETKCGNANCLESYINSEIVKNDGFSVPSTITRAIEQKIKDLVFAFSPSLIIIDLDAFPEISDEVISELESFAGELEKTVGLEGVEVRKPVDKERSATRGAVIDQFNKSLLEPHSFSALMNNYNQR